MPYEVSFDAEEGIVMVRVFGAATHEEHRSAQKEAFRLCDENRSLKILADFRDLDTSKSTTANCYDSGEFLAEAHKNPLTRIANILPGDNHAMLDVQFVATVAGNRGRISEQFVTVEEAKQWLLGK
jgi:hypothetical protein